MFRPARKGEKISALADADPVVTMTPGHADRGELLRRISNFLLDLELDVTPGNLAVAHEIVAGGNPGLSRRIAERKLADGSVTQAWLDDVTSDTAHESRDRAEAQRRGALDGLAGKLDHALRQFSQNAARASSATAKYHEALAETVAGIEAVRPMVELPGLSRATRGMIATTLAITEDMRRHEGEAAGLRETLRLARAEAAMDRLTGMDNAGTFAAVLDREVRTARDAGDKLSVAVCDIDRFKAINETHGRDTGDRVVEAIARVLQRISGQSCHVTRHGDEEFVLLFRGLTPDEARQALDHARVNFALRKLVNRKTHVAIGSVTFSGGVADALAYGDPQAALKAADEALNAAKEQGRNRIVVAPRITLPPSG